MGYSIDILAGMPSFSLSDVAKLRIEAISFFLVVILVCAWGVKFIWNALANDFPKLPRMTYWRALGAIVLWGFVFVIILTMISGARELMTPGAWEKEGTTYKLKERP